MAEHTDEDIVVWNGEYGRTDFFQSEFRYGMGLKSGPPVGPAPSVAYRVNAQNHIAIGFGIYCVILAGGKMRPLEMFGGLNAIIVADWSTWVYGFKDINAKNWDGAWPAVSRITCIAFDTTQNRCLDGNVA